MPAQCPQSHMAFFKARRCEIVCFLFTFSSVVNESVEAQDGM